MASSLDLFFMNPDCCGLQVAVGRGCCMNDVRKDFTQNGKCGYWFIDFALIPGGAFSLVEKDYEIVVFKVFES